MNLTRINWPKGWRPSDDDTNGDPQGLLRMDNLCYDENGILSLARGSENINSSAFGNFVHTVYSKKINGDKHRILGLTDGTVHASTGSSFSELFNGGSIGYNACTSGLGFVYCFSGNKRMKYNGTDVTNITPEIPSDHPTIVEAAKNDFFFLTTDFSGMTSDIGMSEVNSSNYYQLTTVKNIGSAKYTPGTPWNTMSMGAGGVGEPNDSFWLVFRASDTSLLKSVRVIFSDTDTAHPRNYFYYQWDNVVDGQFNAGTDIWTVLKCSRKDFIQVSTTEALGWESIKSFKIIVESTGEFTFQIGENGVLFIGSNTNPLNGWYEYIQVNVHNSGTATFRSPASPKSPYVTLVNGAAQITPIVPTDTQVNEIWFYRRDVTYLDDVRELGEARKLDKWYQVKVLTSDFGTPFVDNMSDEEALLTGITFPVDPWSVTIQTSGGYLDEEIRDVSEPFNGRLFLMGSKNIYITYPDDYGLYSNLWTLKLSGDTTETNLWIKKVSNNQLVVGTTSDIYEISGTCQELPDLTLDIRITPIGVEYPPWHRAVACDHNIIYYLAADGIRAIAGSQSQLISPQLDLLFREEDRHGVFSVYKAGTGSWEFALEVSQGKLWFPCTLRDGNKRTFVYDIKNQLWFLWDTDPTFIYAEEDDILLGAYADGFIRKLWTGTTLKGVGQNVFLKTVFDYNAQPRNRKDVFTLKITADTANTPVTIYLGKDNGSLINLGTYAFNGIEEKLIEIATTVGLGFRYQLQISGTNLTECKIYNFTIEYDPRPEQLNYLRLPANNLGSISRKRFITYGMVIDTLGNNITFTPLIDNVSATTSEASNSAKETYVHYFNEEVVGTDIGGILSGGTFEFYGLNSEEIVSEKLPSPTKFLIIPSEDYGTPNRKRHSSYKFQIHSRGSLVRFTPRIDGVSYTSFDFSTSEKLTVEYFFGVDTIGIDIGGTLQSLTDTPFEFYGVIKPQEVEVLPPRLTYFRIPENNYGLPAKKRIRTMPMEINTDGSNVSFTPIVDGVSGVSSIFNTAHRQTVLHYFTDDQFGIDFSGDLLGAEPFEFYGLATPLDVEVLPVGRKFDQAGPLELDRLGRVMGFRTKLYTTGTSIPFKIYTEDTEVWSGSFVTVPNTLQIYEVMRVPKTVQGTSLRIVYGPTDVFHRYWTKVRVTISGLNTDNQEFPLQ